MTKSFLKTAWERLLLVVDEVARQDNPSYDDLADIRELVDLAIDEEVHDLEDRARKAGV